VGLDSLHYFIINNKWCRLWDRMLLKQINICFLFFRIYRHLGPSGPLLQCFENVCTWLHAWTLYQTSSCVQSSAYLHVFIDSCSRIEVSRSIINVNVKERGWYHGTLWNSHRACFNRWYGFASFTCWLLPPGNFVSTARKLWLHSFQRAYVYLVKLTYT
jgi:hypothetical protein